MPTFEAFDSNRTRKVTLGIEIVAIGNAYWFGALAAVNEGIIQQCYSTGNLSDPGDSQYIGGLVGDNRSTNYGHGVIENCFSKTNVRGGLYAGGLVDLS